MTTQTLDEIVAQPVQDIAVGHAPAYGRPIPKAGLCWLVLRRLALHGVSVDSLGERWQFDPDKVEYVQRDERFVLSCAESWFAYEGLSLEDIQAEEHFYRVSSGFDAIPVVTQNFDNVLSAALETVGSSEFADVFQGSAWTEFALIKRLQSIDEVAAIYVGEYLEEKLVFVIIDMDSYDLGLMDALFDREYELKAKFPHATLSFSYLPLQGREPAELVGKGARLIWERGQFVLRAIA
jgi:hypothetical protein